MKKQLDLGLASGKPSGRKSAGKPAIRPDRLSVTNLDLSDLQSLRKQNGSSFEDICKRSWLALPGVWRMKVSDVAGCGSRPADELVLSREYNFLIEEKSCSEDIFPLSMLRPDQVRGLLEFEAVLPERNRGILAVRFEEHGMVFLTRFRYLMQYLRDQEINRVRREEFLKRAFLCVQCPQSVIYPETYDFGGVFSLCE